MKKVLSIIVSYNFEPWLDKCLQSLLDSEYPTDIIVLDNASKDKTVERIRQDYPQVRLIENKQNLGFGKANNIGMQIALEEGYDFAFLINQDAWIDSKCLTYLTQQNAADYGIISPKHMDGTENALDTGFAHYTKHATSDEHGLFKAPFINAAFWLIPRSVLAKIGGFSPIFYHYGEDKDYANRIQFHQLKTVFHPKALAFHDRQNRKSTFEGQIKADYVYYLTEYCNINYGFITAFAKGIGGATKKSLQSFIAGKFKYSAAYFNMLWRLLVQTSAVLKTRKTNKLTNQAIL